MRFAFPAINQILLCLLLLPVLCCPAHAAEGGKAKPALRHVPGHAPASAAVSSQTASGRTAQAVPKSAAGAGQNPETKQAAGEAGSRANWVKMEPGSRQAYVGIHGGTAPLSLVCSTDGVLFAFTGQTGNDFTQVLRGGNASRTSANGTQHSGQHLSGNGMRAPETAVDTRTVPEQAPRLADENHPAVAQPRAARRQDADKTVPPGALEPASRAGSPVAVAPAATADAAAASGQTAADRASGATTASAQANAETGTDSVTAVRTAPVRPSAPQALPPASRGQRNDPGEAAAVAPVAADSAKPPSPSNSADLVFASGELASSIKDAPEFLPFGLTPPAVAADNEQVDGRSAVPAKPPVPAPRPLKLRSYQRVLNYSGSV